MTDDKKKEKQKVFGDAIRGLVEGHICSDETFYPITGQLLKTVSSLKSMQDVMARSFLDIIKYVGILTQEDRQVTRRVIRPKVVPEKGLLNDRHIKGTVQFLEKGYLAFIDKTIMQYPKEAMLGGRPTLNDKVRAFLSLRLAQGHMKGLVLDCVQGIPVWAQLFYLIRCGDVESAVSFVKMNANVFYRLDGNLMLYLEAYYDSKLEGDLKKKVMARYHELLQANPQSQDPFKIILYELLAAMPLASLSSNSTTTPFYNTQHSKEPSVSGHHPSVLTTIEDWVWYHLMHCDAEDGRLEAFQGTILTLGMDYFLPEDATTATSDPLLYVKILLWCGRYIEAIQALFDMNLSLEAVHLALLLAYGHLYPIDVESAIFISYKQYLDDLTHQHPQVAFYYIMVLALLHPTCTLQAVSLNLLNSWTLKTNDIAFAYGTMDAYGHYHVISLNAIAEHIIYFLLYRMASSSSISICLLTLVIIFERTWLP
jgi:nuclear pore complex protein Nup93